MEQAYFLIPGLLLPDGVEEKISTSSLSILTSLTTGATKPGSRQILVGTSQKKSPHLKWLWSVLTQKTFAYATAPYRWLLMQGPMLGGEIWRLTLTKTTDGRFGKAAVLTEVQTETVASLLTRPLASFGFTLQRWDRSFFLTRKKTWGVTTREFETLFNEVPVLHEAIESTEDSHTSEDAIKTITALNETLKSLNDSAFDALWIDGGGYAQDFYPPTLVRSVLANDTAILGWAQAAGILNHRTAEMTHATGWPEEAPRGTSIAVFDALYDAWLRQDWVQWQKELPNVATQLLTLKDAARRRGCEEALIVGFGENSSVTFATKLTNPRSLLAKFVRPSVIEASLWITE